MREIVFVLPFALTSLNVRDRQHWAERHRAQDQLHLEILAAIGGSRYLPRPPFARARVTVSRHSAGRLDTDNAHAACKGLLDILCIRSRTHPLGLGIITDDNPGDCELHVQQGVAPPGQASTAVRVEELPAAPPAPAKRPWKPRQPRHKTTSQASLRKLRKAGIPV